MTTNGTSPLGSECNAELGPGSKARWYCLSLDGLATLCSDEEDAKEVAAESQLMYPKNGPYRVAQMVDASAVAAAVAAERARCLADCEAVGDLGAALVAQRIRDRA